MPAPRYWSDVFTVDTWEEARGHGFKTSGFRETRWNWAKRLKPGDILICYLQGHNRFVGALEVRSDPYMASEPRIWKVDPFPARVDVRPLVALTPETAVPVGKVLDRLEVVREGGDPKNWGVYFQGSPRLMRQADGELILSELREAERNPVVIPIRVHEPRAKGEPQPPREPTPEVSVAAAEREPIVREHVRMQGILLRLGKDLGLQPWVARGDRGYSVEKATKLADLSIARLPILFQGPAQQIVESIDVLWLKGSTIVAAFEVEHSTDVFSGLLRMADLVALQPYIRIRLFIVAPAEREDKVKRELLRPTFAQVLDPPLVELCRFISYERISSAVEKAGEFIRSMKAEDFLSQLATSYKDDFAKMYAEAL